VTVAIRNTLNILIIIERALAIRRYPGQLMSSIERAAGTWKRPGWGAKLSAPLKGERRLLDMASDALNDRLRLENGKHKSATAMCEKQVFSDTCSLGLIWS